MDELDWIDGYLHTFYIGFIEGKYDVGCNLYLKDINNFIQNVGRYVNVEIIRVADSDTLLNTCGNYVDRIWPRMSSSDRDSNTIRECINYIASKLTEFREEEGYFPEPLPKIKKYMSIVLGKEIVEKNEIFLRSVKEVELNESWGMEMSSS